MARVWRHLRAWLVGMHVVVILVLAIPNTGPGLERTAWQNPTVQGELRTWSERLTDVGIAVTPAELEVWAYDMATRMHAARTAVTEPLTPYHRYAGIRQPWNMFVAPHLHPAVLEVDILVDGEWSPLYRARSSEHDYRRDFFDHDRIRAMLFRYGWPVYRGHYDNFARWLAKQIARDYPGATKARMIMRRTRTPTPEEARAGAMTESSVAARTVFDLAPFREAAP